MSSRLINQTRNWPYPERELSLNTKKQLALVKVLPISIKPYSLGQFATCCNFIDPYSEWYLLENERELISFFQWAVLDNDLAKRLIQNENLILLASIIRKENHSENPISKFAKYITEGNEKIDTDNKSICQYLDYLKEGIHKSSNEMNGMNIYLKSFADILLFKDEEAFKFLIPANNYLYEDDSS